jgi:hypothetical protein
MLLSRGSVTLTAVSLIMLASSASAQPLGIAGRPSIFGQINPNPVITRGGLTLQQAAFNTAVLGQAARNIPPYLLGYNPYSRPIINSPSIIAPALGNPYALSTAASLSPFSSGFSPGSGVLSNSPYSLSTTGSSGLGGMGGLGGFGGYGGYGMPIYTFPPAGATLIGAAALTDSAGKYQISIQQARILREQSRSAMYDNMRRRVELERWYESTRTTPQQIRDREMAGELDKARKDSTDSEINSGKALNILLGSIQKSISALNRGPTVPVQEKTLQNVNLAPSSAAGNVGMLKDISKLTWPEGLQESNFDEPRKRLNKNLAAAVAVIKDGDPVPATLIKDIRGDYKTINDKLNDAPDELTTQQYIEARRFVNQLHQAIRALADPKVTNYFNNAWTAKGKNVAELVSHMTQEGLSFAPAAPGDQAAYKALYLALRQFEAGLETAKK